ncbi:OmpA family protein [Bacterioplanoides sp.]|uniref:OmpA family protein n=1 Tax=Bacterioplanoides sp. TaxID=2066072 RepID=UPI003B5C19E6
MSRTLFFFLICLFVLPFSALATDVDRDGLCADNINRSYCQAGPDQDDSNPDVDGDGICDGIRSVSIGSVRCMQKPNPGSDSDGDGTFDELESGDSDADGIPDYLDLDTPANGFGDSDNDGIDDRLECGGRLPCLNSDGDSIFDYRDPDSDNDGVLDSEEADHIVGSQPVEKPFDIDGDGQPDFRDIDSDADGRSDQVEGSAANDQDMDGIPDRYDADDRNDDSGLGGDSDNDGISDKAECPQFPTDCPDSDSPEDGKPDYLDNNLDSDDDGIPDASEDLNLDKDNNPATMATDTDRDGDADYLDGDSDNDGLLDRDERNNPFNAAARLDTDNDGIPDVVDFDGRLNANSQGGDSDSDGVADKIECPQWPACPDTDKDGAFDYLDSDSSPPKPDPGEVSTGVDGVGAIWWLLVLFPLIAVTGRAQAEEPVTDVADVSGFVSESAMPDLYINFALGRSQLEPDTSASLYSLDRKGDWAYRLSGGWDLNQYWSVEGYYADLGKALLKPEGEVSYQVFGGSIIGNYWLLGGERLPGALALTGRAGLASLSTNASGVRLKQNNSLQLTFAAGLELYFDHNYSVRLEVESFDSDATLMSLGLSKRFGLQQQLVYAIPQGDSLAMLNDLPPTSAGIRRAIIKPLVIDADEDGLLDDVDLCLNTPPYSPQFQVNEQGCAPFQGVIDGVDFISGREQLTGSGKARLQQLLPILAEQLKKIEKLRLQIRAHTDSQGAAGYNRQLSQRRANEVARYLLDSGIEPSRLDARGMGETTPRADNATAQGRALNRRVEFILISERN